MEECWRFMNELEQVWTGVEDTDRASILKLADRTRMRLIMVCPLRHTIQYLSDLVGILCSPSKAGVDRQ